MATDKFVIEVTAENFQEAVVENSQKVPVLLDFWAPWCQPCKSLIPVLHKIAEDFNGALILAKINTEENPELGSHFQIRSIPTVMLVKDGAVVDKFNGALPESGVLEFLKKHGVVNQLDAILEEAKNLSASGDFETLVEILNGALQEYSDNTQIKQELAKGLIRLHKLDEAKSILDLVSDADKMTNEYKALYASLSFSGEVLNADELEKLQEKASSGDLEALDKLAMNALTQGEYETGLEYLMQILSKDKSYNNGQSHKTLLDTLALLGNSNPLVATYRRKLFTLLY